MKLDIPDYEECPKDNALSLVEEGWICRHGKGVPMELGEFSPDGHTWMSVSDAWAERCGRLADEMETWEPVPCKRCFPPGTSLTDDDACKCEPT